MPDITGPPVTLDGAAIQGAAITAINNDTGAVLGETTTDSAGNWTITVAGGQTVHVLSEYEGGDGTLYRDQSRPFMVIESTSGLPQPVGTPFVWYPMDEGTGTTVTDNTATHDATIQGDASWVTGTWIGDAAVDGGTAGTGGGWIETTTFGTYGSQTDGQIAICLTAQIPAGDDSYLVGWSNTGNNMQLLFGPNDFLGPLGNIGFALRATAGGRDGVYTDTTWDDGAKHRFVVNKTGPSVLNDVEIWVDGTQQTLSASHTDGFDTTAVADFDVAGGILSQQTGSSNSAGTADDAVFYTTSLTAQEIADDYARQPWSA